MAAQRGKDILLKLFDDGAQAFVSVAGLRTKRIAFGAQSVDITDTESAGRWRELLGGAGVRRVSVSGTGIFKDAASDALVRQAFFDGTIAQWQIVIPDFGTITGAFSITALDYAGNHDGEVTFELALESAAEPAFGAL
ncbi:phage major tail protein, TP901-1 family [Roseitalea porphyridii]|uniref:Phage major tail protein, TP901-1 family n=1 Tax=Roseitalea porphyridii TaxID=1852022 RepID=A0A4P6V0E5_9HYPH|nr:phage major tail protein, TP901-1 family [Roseitalea porphyridii]QBK30094.1 phage major tail protein, TP901-1 family [Roseitalea porphyridii]